jgi:hypothetical protein
VCQSVFGYYFAAFVDGVLRLDVERSEKDSWNLSDFVEWEWESKASNDVVGYHFLEEVLLLDCAFVVAKNESLINVLNSVLFIKGLKGPL